MNQNPLMVAPTAMAEPYAGLVRAAGILAWPVRALARAYRVRRTTDELMSLDARILRDIGIDRGGIVMVARASVEYPAVDPRHVLERRQRGDPEDGETWHSISVPSGSCRTPLSQTATPARHDRRPQSRPVPTILARFRIPELPDGSSGRARDEHA